MNGITTGGLEDLETVCQALQGFDSALELSGKGVKGVVTPSMKSLQHQVEVEETLAQEEHTRASTKKPRAHDPRKNKAKINKKLRCTLIDKSIHHHVLILCLASNKSGGSGERGKGGKPNARTQLSTRPSTRPHQSAPPHRRTRTIRRVRTSSLSEKADQRPRRTRSA